MQFLSQEGNNRNFMLIAALSLIFMLNNRQRRSLFFPEPPVSDLSQIESTGEYITDEEVTDEEAKVIYDEGTKEEAFEILQAEPADGTIQTMEAEIYAYPAESEENFLDQEVEET